MNNIHAQQTNHAEKIIRETAFAKMQLIEIGKASLLRVALPANYT